MSFQSTIYEWFCKKHGPFNCLAIKITRKEESSKGAAEAVSTTVPLTSMPLEQLTHLCDYLHLSAGFVTRSMCGVPSLAWRGPGSRFKHIANLHP